VTGKVPLALGALHATTAEAAARSADTLVGADDEVMTAEAVGVTGAEALEATEEPTEFVATTVKVYAESSVSPGTVQARSAVVQVAPPGAAVTVYAVIDAPPV